MRGIEIRRHDAPNFIKEFQTELLYTLFDCKNSAEVLSEGYEHALLLVTGTIDKVMTGEIQLKNLVVSKKLRQDLTKYKRHDNDKEKYREMLLEAAESILGYFGFDRTVYGDSKKNRKWWYKLRQECQKEIQNERI